MKEKIYKISEVAHFLNISTTTIRYYEEYGLFKPVFIDKESSYRYYDVHNINTISNILSLRESGMGMAQIKKYLNEQFTMNDYIFELKKKRFQIEKLIRQASISNPNINEYDVDFMYIPASFCFKKEIVASNLDDLYRKFMEFIQDSIGIVSIPINFFSYIKYDSYTPKFENIKAVLGFDIKNFIEGCSYHKDITAIKTYHNGSKDSILKAYEFLNDYCIKNNIKLLGYVIEDYLKLSNFSDDKNDYITELIYPIDINE